MKECRVWWLGHMQRIENMRKAKITNLPYTPRGRRDCGRPRKRGR
jgi:hypothetical protein